MKHLSSKSAFPIILLSMTGMIIPTQAMRADDEKIAIEILEIRVQDNVYTPFYTVETEQYHQRGSTARWLRLGVNFTTEGGWIDESEIQLKAAFNSPNDMKVVLSETERYINLKPGDHWIYMYLHPSYVERYDIDASTVESAAFITLIGKQLAVKETNGQYPEGWSKKSNGGVEKGYLLNHSETPFWYINYDFNEVIKH